MKYGQLIAAFIFLLMVAGQVGTDIYLPSLPAMAIDLHTDHRYVQWSIAFFFFTYGITQLFYGPLADRYGRKKPLLVALSIYAAGSVLAIFAPTIHVLLVARLIQGIGAGGCSVLPRAIMRDVFSGKELQKINIYQSAVWSVMFLIAPLMGGYIQEYLGWRANFVCILLIILVGITAWFFVAETHRPQETQRLKLQYVLKEYAQILTHREFWPSLLGTAVSAAIFVTFIVFIAIFLPKILHFSPIAFGWVTVILAIGYMVGLVFSRILVHRIRETTMIGIGIAFSIVATVGMLLCSILAPQSILFLINLFILQIGTAFIFPSIIAVTLHLFPHKAGKAAALVGCTIFMSNLLATLVVSFIPNNTWLYMSLFYVILMALLLFSFVHIKRVSVKA